MKILIFAAIIATAMPRPSYKGDVEGEDLFPCMSAANKAAEKTCHQLAKNKTTSSGTTSTAAAFCMPQCILQQYKALDSQNKINQAGLTAVISATNLTSTQKTNATNILKACLADTTANATTVLNECVPDQNGPPRPAQANQPARPQPQNAGQQRPQMTTECLNLSKGLACLVKSLSANDCGPLCAAGHGRRPPK